MHAVLPAKPGLLVPSSTIGGGGEGIARAPLHATLTYGPQTPAAPADVVLLPCLSATIRTLQFGSSWRILKAEVRPMTPAPSTTTLGPWERREATVVRAFWRP
jgi:hypothetical protein